MPLGFLKYFLLWTALIISSLFLSSCSSSNGGGGDTVISSASNSNSASGGTPTNAPPTGTGNTGTTFVLPPIANAVNPSSGPSDVNTTITISGSNFLEGNQVLIGGQPALNVVITSSTSITCQVPTGTANTSVDIAVVGGTANVPSVIFGAFTYVFFVTSSNASAGLATGGETILLSGGGFSPGVQVFFGDGNLAGNISIVNQATISCTTPAGTSGTTVDIIIENTIGEQEILPTAFLYADLLVSNGNDSGAGSLRDVLSMAQGTLANEIIGFNLSAIGSTINLTSGEISLTADVTLLGPGATLLSIDANNNSRIFNVSVGVELNLSGLRLQNGFVTGESVNAASSGGAIFANDGTVLTLSNCIFSGNFAAEKGGAIFVGRFTTGALGDSVLTISDCIFDSNEADALDTTSDGGAVSFFLTLGGTLNIDRCTFVENIAGDNGGAFEATSGALVNCSNSTFDSNDAGLADTAGGDGGAIFVLNTGTLTTIENCTFSGNTTPDQGGAIYNTSAASLIVLHSTFTLNSGGNGGGIFSSATLTLYQSIVAGNSSGATGDVSNTGTMTSLGFNFIGNNLDSASSFPVGFPNGNNDYVGTSGSVLDPDLGPLANNGGPTLTHTPNSLSPVIDIGDPLFSSPPNFDQRGIGFPRELGSVIDIGAVEFP